MQARPNVGPVLREARRFGAIEETEAEVVAHVQARAVPLPDHLQIVGDARRAGDDVLHVAPSELRAAEVKRRLGCR